MTSLSGLSHKTVLVTGGTGTFGQAFVAKLLATSEVQKIIVFSRDEFKQSQMQRDVSDPEDRLRFFLGDVRDLSRLIRALEGVDVVVHAAALKQVPAIEYNPLEAIKTNIVGTQNVIDAALDSNVEKVLLISSDKAVQPINLYGATKLCAERLCVAANAYRGKYRPTKFSVVRYGNVWGSRGSLIELIHKQRPTGTVTLTDERMTRFLIKINDVIDIIFSALRDMQGGEIFVPKMKSFRICDLMKILAPGCAIKVIGVRPGEKLHETLITEHETPRTKDAGYAFVIQPEFEHESNWEHDSWLKDLPPFPVQSSYFSNNPELLLNSDAARAIFGV